METKTDIVIIGAGLTGLSLAYWLRKAGKEVKVLERSSHVGGVINTITENGFTYETGPNTGVIGSPELVALFDSLKGTLNVETPGPEAKFRWIWKDGKWNALPSGLLSAISTPLFTMKDKFRILGEPFRKPGTNPDETVADMVVRRMGRSFLDYAVDPFISGVYAGDPHRLVTRFALPKLYALENNYGSFVKGSMKKRKLPKTALEKRVTREVFSAKGGLQHLIQALHVKIGEEHVLTDSNGIKFHKEDNGYVCSFTDKENSNIQLRSKYVITTVPGNCLHGLFSFLEDKDLLPITNLNYAKVVQVAVGYKTWTGKPLNAFGGLVPSLEKRNCLGILFPSSLFENRAPEGGALLSMFLGGIKKPEFITKSDEEITQIVLDEVKETLQCEQKPDLIKIFRHENAIPQYELSSGQRFSAIEDIQSRFPGLILAGNIRNGIGMSDRVKQAVQIANSLINMNWG